MSQQIREFPVNLCLGLTGHAASAADFSKLCRSRSAHSYPSWAGRARRVDSPVRLHVRATAARTSDVHIRDGGRQRSRTRTESDYCSSCNRTTVRHVLHAHELIVHVVVRHRDFRAEDELWRRPLLDQNEIVTRIRRQQTKASLHCHGA
jgi:hypothetical protein